MTKTPTAALTSSPRVLVLGRPGFLKQLTIEVAADADLALVLPPEESPPANWGEDVVAVLVAPGRNDWVTARCHGLPIVLIVPGIPDSSDIIAAILDGADCILDGSATPESLLAAIKAAWGRDTYLASTHVKALVDFLRVLGEMHVAPPLSMRERQILDCIERGLSTKQTARELGIAFKTAENLQLRLFKKLPARNRPQAVARAHALQLLSRSGSGYLRTSPTPADTTEGRDYPHD